MNAVVSDQVQNNVAEFKAPGPGERLKAARLSLDLDIPKLAEKIHLTRDMVDCIERDDYSDAPARVFVRGYVNNYARAVDLPAESVLRQFDELWPEDDNLAKVSMPTPRLPADVKPSNSFVRFITWLLLLGGIALFLVWWQGYLDQFISKLEASSHQVMSADVKPQKLEANVEETTEMAAKPKSASLLANKNTVVSRDVQPALGSANLILPKTAEIASVKEVVSADTVVEQIPNKPTVVNRVLPPEAELVRKTEKPVKPKVEAAPVVASTAPVVEAPVVENVVIEKGVFVTFKATSWVDIRDSTRKFKIFGEVKQGSRRKLGGKAPYKIVIGNARGVAITTDGKPYDMTPYTKGNVARFTFKP